MSSTRLHRTVTTTDRDVNTSGSTFGGHLLRLGYEHALAVAEAHAGTPCNLLAANDIAFLTLVPIGAELYLVRIVPGAIVRSASHGQ
jgi:acyl-coenzyme A thioesterase 9